MPFDEPEPPTGVRRKPDAAEMLLAAAAALVEGDRTRARSFIADALAELDQGDRHNDRSQAK